MLQPHALGASRAGVGACAWDSTFMLLAYFGEPLLCCMLLLLQAEKNYHGIQVVQVALHSSNSGKGHPCLRSGSRPVAF